MKITKLTELTDKQQIIAAAAVQQLMSAENKDNATLVAGVIADIFGATFEVFEPIAFFRRCGLPADFIDRAAHCVDSGYPAGGPQPSPRTLRFKDGIASLRYASTTMERWVVNQRYVIDIEKDGDTWKYNEVGETSTYSTQVITPFIAARNATRETES